MRPLRHARSRARNLRQWILQITAYAERLLEDLDTLDWPESLSSCRRNWIGSSEGAIVRFALEKGDEAIEVFTTRPDTLFGATYMVLSPSTPSWPRSPPRRSRRPWRPTSRPPPKKSDLERTDLAKEKSGVFTGALRDQPA